MISLTGSSAGHSVRVRGPACCGQRRSAPDHRGVTARLHAQQHLVSQPLQQHRSPSLVAHTALPKLLDNFSCSGRHRPATGRRPRGTTNGALAVPRWLHGPVQHLSHPCITLDQRRRNAVEPADGDAVCLTPARSPWSALHRSRREQAARLRCGTENCRSAQPEHSGAGQLLAEHRAGRRRGAGRWRSFRCRARLGRRGTD